MDLGDGDGGATPVVLADWLDRLLSSWHDHRVAISGLFLLCVLSVWLRPWQRRHTRAGPVTPPTSSSGLEKALAVSERTGNNVARDDDDHHAVSMQRQRETKVKLTTKGDHGQEQAQVQAQDRKPRPTAARVVTGRKPAGARSQHSGQQQLGRPPLPAAAAIQPLIFFSSLTGTTERLSKRVASELEAFSSQADPQQAAVVLPPQVHDISYIDLDDYFISGPKPPTPTATATATPVALARPSPHVRYFYLLLIPSYDIDTILNTFLAHLDETHHDFRIDTSPLSTLAGYTVFGIGDKQGWPSEDKGFCSQAVEVDKWMAKLTGRKRAYPVGLGDVKGNLDGALHDWTVGVCSVLAELGATGTLGEGVPGSGEADESADEEEDEGDDGEGPAAEDVEFPDSGRNKRRKLAAAIDLEDVGGKNGSRSSPLAVDFTTTTTVTTTAPSSAPAPAALKAMVPKESPTHAALTKQGYTIIGTHSGVKICRWTKSALRGRGSCYKNSFYGIASHLCMETTPSLSCSNKCVFCWRHGTNPVSTTWRWQVDDPQVIFDGAKDGHYKKIKMMRGVPGVRSDRFAEAMRIRHCALSLVGEPIFYPRINEFVGLLHSEHISSFLVCNAQHPQQLRDLQRVTQLYVSIDASNKDSLRKIDRPLHRDFWERFQACLDILREKRFVQRTVFRLTLVKGFNVEEEVEGYADLVARGLPCFIEVKGVTYCGTSTSSSAGLTMGNVPFYHEVVAFVEALDRALAQRGLDYGLAAEHAHSCCVLLASKRFLINHKWHTVIDYDRFFDLLDRGVPFTPEDYCKETPEWALWGNGGFDPRDVRVDRKGRPKDQS